MSKSADAFRTISEVGRMALDTTPRMSCAFGESSSLK